MAKASLSVREALRFANHDFLNHLHLIQLNLDLNRVDEAKQIINSIANECKTFSNAGKIRLPKTLEWLQTFEWRYPSIKMTLKSEVNRALDSKWDESIKQYLENTIIHLHETLDPFIEHELQVELISTDADFKIDVWLHGKWEAEYREIENTKLTIQTYEYTNHSWHYVLSIKE